MDEPPSYDGIYGEGEGNGREETGYSHSGDAGEAGDALLGRRRPSFVAFDVIDDSPTGDGARPATPTSRAAAVAFTLKNSIIVPVRHFVVDPVAKLWHSIGTKFDEIIDPYINPLLARRILVLVITSLVLTAIYFTQLAGAGGAADGEFTDLLESRNHLRSYISVDKMQHVSDYFDSLPHYAGTAASYTTSKYVLDSLSSYGISVVNINDMPTFLTHPDKTTLYLLGSDGEVISQTSLQEGHAHGEDLRNEQPAPHMALGVGGDVTGQLVYANYGMLDDFNFLKAQGIEVSDKIVILRYGVGDPGTNAKRAEEAGAKGVLFFSQKHPTAAAWPDGPDYSEDAVQRASLGLPQVYPGDILSPGWPSTANMKINDFHTVRSVVKIPVAAMSWKDAGIYLNSLKGQGVHVEDWANNGYPRDVEEWWTGDGNSPQARLEVKVLTETRHSIYNILSRITGREQDNKAIVLGAKLDTHCGGGVGTSGLVVLMEVARALAYLRYEQKWDPLRPIYFMAWDGSMHNFAGATEWVESVDGQLREDGTLYIDLDAGVSGTELEIRGHPAIVLEDILKAVTYDNGTLWDQYSRSGEVNEGKLQQYFGNYEVFSAHTGIPSISMAFKGDVYPKDSCFDTMEWQRKFGDKDFEAHRALAELVAFTVLEYADSPVIPFDFGRFSLEMHRYVEHAQDYATRLLGPKADTLIDFGPVTRAIDGFMNTAVKFREWSADWTALALASPAEQEAPPARKYRQELNDKLNMVNKRMMDRFGIGGQRVWFKHVVYGIQFDVDPSDPLTATFPGIRDAIRVGDVKAAQKAIELVATGIETASEA